jgi:chromosome segregation ATPase
MTTDVPALLDEVERLTRELERAETHGLNTEGQRLLADALGIREGKMTADGTARRAVEEIERLTRERDEARDRILEYTDALVERDAEIASLTAALDERDGEAERVREQYNTLADERDEARAIANAAVRELNDANARAAMVDQLLSNSKGLEP